MTAVLERPTAPPPPAAGTGNGWRPALRIARRELRRAPGRTLLVLLMVLLPVTAVVALDTLLRTADVSLREGLPRDLGGAEARIDPLGGGPVRQTPDGARFENGGVPAPAVDVEALGDVLPAGSRLLTVRESAQQVLVRAQDGRTGRATLLGLDLRDPGTRGPYVVLDGRAPATAEEVAVTAPLARSGFDVGSRLVLPGGDERTVTGTVQYPLSYGTPRAVVGLPAAVGLAEREPSRFYVSGAPVTWQDVQEVNALGATVLSRTVLADPPANSELPSIDDGGQAATTAAIIGLIAVMAVLEVVLLAGPAFAVGARRQRRALALMAATGAEPRHLRRVVLAQGVLVGAAAALLGAPLGIAVAGLARAPLGRWNDASWGPFDVGARDVALVSLLGAATAVLAALLPARSAARQPVVASLQGRRPQPVRAALPTAAGLALLTVGSVLSVASLSQGFPELWIAFAALPTVIGAVLLAPVLLAAAGRFAGRLPLPLRYAVRDADRQRARTAPAVAAIAATVAAAIALGTANASDAAEAARTYTPAGPVGVGLVTGQPLPGAEAPDWDALAELARRTLPGEPVRQVRGLPVTGPGGPDATYDEVQLCPVGAPAGRFCGAQLGGAYGASLGSSVLVGPDAVDVLAPLLDPVDAAAARRVVAGGGVAGVGVPAGEIEVRRFTVQLANGQPEEFELVGSATAAAVPVGRAEHFAPAQAILSEQVAQRLGGARTVALAVGESLSGAQERQLRDAVAAADGSVLVSVERGYQPAETLVVLVLGLIAATLVLAGTLAATSLALVEARPDFVTLHQVGARPGTRRLVAGAYAAVIALAGSALGVAAGLIPGVAAAVALTRYSSVQLGHSGVANVSDRPGLEFVVVPWLLVAALLLVLPMAAAAVAALTTRGRVGTARTP